MIEIDIQLFLRHAIRKLLDPINQSSYFICVCFNFFDRTNSSEKGVIVEEELDCIDDIGNLEDSPRLMFINKECGNLIVVNDRGELTKNINQKKNSDVLQKSIVVHLVTNVVGESICYYRVNNLKR